jgi:hypothetical protein
MCDVENIVEPLLKTYHNISHHIVPNHAADPARSSWLDSAVASQRSTRLVNAPKARNCMCAAWILSPKVRA